MIQPSQTSPQLNEASQSQSEEGMWDLGWLFGALRRKSLLILQIAVLTTLVSAGLVFLKTAVSKPEYKGKFQMLVEPATAEGKLSKSFVQAQSPEKALEMQSTNNLEQSSTLDYETQIRILQSPTLMQPILKRVQLRYPEVTYETLIRDLGIDRIKITKEGKEQGTKLLEVDYTAPDTQQVLFVLEEISKAYLKYSLKERQTTIRQGIKFIEEQLPQLQERVNTLQAQIETLRQQNSLMDPEQQGNEITQQITRLRGYQLDTLSKLTEAQSRYRVLQEQLSGNNAIAVLSEYPSFQKLLDQYQELEGQLANATARLDEDSPPMQSLRRKQRELNDLLVQEAERILGRASGQVEVLQSQQQVLTQADNFLNQEIRQLPTVARQYSGLKREVQIATDTLDRFLSKREALGIDAAQQEIPWELTSPPDLVRDDKGTPINATNRNKRLLVALAAVLSVLLAVGIALLIEIIQDILYTAEEARRVSKLTLLGSIPTLDTPSSLNLIPMGILQPSKPLTSFSKTLDLWMQTALQSKNQNDSSVQYRTAHFEEAFNLLYTNITFLSADNPIRSLAISSPSPQEGKSTISIHLARAAAVAGKRVLLVDTDLRHPQLHTYLGIDNTEGLSDLIQSNLKLEQVVQPSLLEDELLVLTAGQALSSPVRLFSSSKLTHLMQQFIDDFDLVIYDTPPLLNFADANLIGAKTDGLVIVSKLGTTKRADLVKAVESVKLAQIPLMGLVANGCPVDVKAELYGSYYQRLST